MKKRDKSKLFGIKKSDLKLVIGQGGVIIQNPAEVETTRVVDQSGQVVNP